MAQDSKSTRSSSAENLSSFLRERRRKRAAPADADPPKMVLEALLSGPRSMSALMDAVKISFGPLAETLDRLEKYGMVRSQAGAEERTFELTDDGRKAAG